MWGGQRRWEWGIFIRWGRRGNPLHKLILFCAGRCGARLRARLVRQTPIPRAGPGDHPRVPLPINWWRPSSETPPYFFFVKTPFSAGSIGLAGGACSDYGWALRGLARCISGIRLCGPRHVMGSVGSLRCGPTLVGMGPRANDVAVGRLFRNAGRIRAQRTPQSKNPARPAKRIRVGAPHRSTFRRTLAILEE